MNSLSLDYDWAISQSKLKQSGEPHIGSGGLEVQMAGQVWK